MWRGWLLCTFLWKKKIEKDALETARCIQILQLIVFEFLCVCVCVFLVSQHLLHKKHLLVHPAHILPDGLVTSIFIFYFCFDVKSAVTYFNFSVSVRWLTLRLHDAANRKKPTGGTFCDSHQRGRWLLLVASMCKFFRFLNNFSKKKKKIHKTCDFLSFSFSWSLTVLPWTRNMKYVVH